MFIKCFASSSSRQMSDAELLLLRAETPELDVAEFLDRERFHSQNFNDDDYELKNLKFETDQFECQNVVNSDDFNESKNELENTFREEVKILRKTFGDSVCLLEKKYLEKINDLDKKIQKSLNVEKNDDFDKKIQKSFQTEKTPVSVNETFLQNEIKQEILVQMQKQVQILRSENMDLKSKIREMTQDHKKRESWYDQRLRSECHRKALVWTKRYLMAVLEANELDPFPADLDMTKNRFKCVAVMVTSIFRMRFMANKRKNPQRQTSKDCSFE